MAAEFLCHARYRISSLSGILIVAEEYGLSVREFKRRVLEGVARAVREGVGVYYSTTEDEFATREYSKSAVLIVHDDSAGQRHFRSMTLRQQPLTSQYVEFMATGLLRLSTRLLSLKDEKIEGPQIRAKARQLEALAIRIRKVFGEVQREHGEESLYLNALSLVNVGEFDVSVPVTRQKIEVPLMELVMKLMGGAPDVMEFVKRVVDALPEGSLTEEVVLGTVENVAVDHDPPEIVDETRCAAQVVYGGLARWEAS
ncbi:MAG: hypothetical protein CMH81_03750 [Nitrospiraceae bacterium]|nr:hypothetical protein [Nitrospiraceae bacterium]